MGDVVVTRDRENNLKLNGKFKTKLEKRPIRQLK